MHKIARELAKLQERLIILNGAGSFGHIPVKRYGLDYGFSRQKRGSFARTKMQLLRLQEVLVSILCRHGVLAVPFSASSFMTAKSGRLFEVDDRPIRRFLSLGLVPLLGGDLVADVNQGWSVVSADQMAAWIARRMGASMIIYGTDVDGLYSSDPKISKDAELIRKIPARNVSSVGKRALGSRAPDVTSGMRGKLLEAQKAAKSGIEVVIMNLKRPGNLHPILKGKQGRWTRIVP